jgi:cytochrome c biogenesis protein
MALSSNRKIMDTDREFDNLKQKLLATSAAAASPTERSV